MIKIEVTGNSIPEVADKLLAIGASLRASAAADRPHGALKAEAKTLLSKTPSKKAEVMPEVVVVHSSIEDEQIEVIDLPVADTPTLDFDTDIRSLALQLVTQRNKAALEEILAHFGVPRASLVQPARLPELLAMINEALGK